jgi:hypothetical protein
MPRPRKSTLIRNERKATTARKRAAFEFQAPNKKAPSKDGAYNFRAAGAPSNAPVAKPNTPATEVLSHEFCS